MTQADLSLQVFVSSTTSDLKSYRTAVRDFLMKRQLHPVVQEDFPPDYRYRDIQQMLRSKIAASDVVICLVGQAFGYEPVNRPKEVERRSYTQMEFDIAMEMEKPILVFVAREDCEFDSVPEQSTELRQLQLEHIERINATDVIRWSFQNKTELLLLLGAISFHPAALRRTVSAVGVVLAIDLLAGDQPPSGVEKNWIDGVYLPYQKLWRSILSVYRITCTNNGERQLIVTFRTAEEAVAAAMEFRKRTSDGDDEHGPLPVRMGIALGQVTQFSGIDDHNILQTGRCIELAKDLQQLASIGQTLLSSEVANEARIKLENGIAQELCWTSHGRYVWPDGEPMQVMEVGLQRDLPLEPPPGTDRIQRADSYEERQMQGWRPSVGAEIPRRAGWRIARELGKGGFGEVWLAKQEETDEFRVFKFCFEPNRLATLKRELKLSRLMKGGLGERSDISKLYELNFTSPPYYLEGEYIAGGDFLKWMESQPSLPPLSERIRLFAELAEAVAAAHRANVLHRDIKPANVFLRQDPQGVWHPVLADFGIGWVIERSLLANNQITHSGFTRMPTAASSGNAGTRMYQPPELMTGPHFTTEADVYSLGVILYQLLLGNFQEPLGSTHWRKKLADAEPDADLLSEESLTWRLLTEDVSQAVADNPAERFHDANELSASIRELPARVAQLRREEQDRASLALSKRRKLLSVVAGAVALSLFAVIGIVWFAYVQRTRAIEQSVIAEKREYRDRIERAFVDAENFRFVDAMVALDDTRERDRGWEYDYVHSSATSLIAEIPDVPRGLVGSVFHSDGNTLVTLHMIDISQSWEEPSKFETHIHRWNLFPPAIVKSGVVPGAIGRLSAFSGDGRLLFLVTREQVLHIVDAKTLDVVRSVDLRDQVSHIVGLATSNDGRFVATISSLDRSLTVWDAQTWSLRQTIPLGFEPEDVALSPDGELVAACGVPDENRNSEMAGVWRTENSVRLMELKSDSPWDVGYKTLAFSRSGQMLALAGGEIDLVDLMTLETAASLVPAGGCDNPRIEFSDDDRYLFCTAELHSGGSRSVIEKFDLRTRNLTAVCGPIGDDSATLHFSAKNHVLVSAVFSHELKVWDPHGNPRSKILGTKDADVTTFAFSPDSRYLVTGESSGKITLYDLLTGGVRFDISAHEDRVSSVEFSQDGRFIASGGWDAASRVWDANTGKLVKEFVQHTSALSQIAIDPEGKYVATASVPFNFVGRYTDKFDGIRIWEITSGREIEHLDKGQMGLRSLKFTESGLLLNSSLALVPKAMDKPSLVGSEGIIPVYEIGGLSAEDKVQWMSDVQSGAMSIPRLDSMSVGLTCPLSPDRRRIVGIGTAGRVILGETDKGVHVFNLTKDGEAARNARFSPDGKKVAALLEDGWIKVWEPHDASYRDGYDPLMTHHAASIEKAAFFHWNEATEAIAVRDWFAAKVHLQHLTELPPERLSYEKLSLDVIRTKLAECQREWDANVAARQSSPPAKAAQSESQDLPTQ